MNPGYYPRAVDGELTELLAALPAIAVDGPKGVGKTATARRRAASVWELDDPVRRAIAAADPAQILASERPILIDEWQRVPEVWDLVRRAVDDDNSPGQYLLTGSAAPLHAPVHSGAGRIVSLRMRPLALAERGLEAPTVSLNDLLRDTKSSVAGESELTLRDYVREIVASGFPAFRGLSGRPLRAQLDGYLERIVDVDFRELGHAIRQPQTLLRWMTAYAAATATTASYEVIRDASTSGEGDKPAKTTTMPYRDILERLWILDPVPAWLPARNYFSQLSRPPKHHLADPALAARLLGVTETSLLEGEEAGPPIPRDGTLLGGLFESLVTLCVRVYAQSAEAKVKHLRTREGRNEVDLIVERQDHRVVAIEVKLARTIQDDDVSNLRWLAAQIGADLVNAVVINTGPHAYRRSDGIAVVPAALLGP